MQVIEYLEKKRLEGKAIYFLFSFRITLLTVQGIYLLFSLLEIRRREEELRKKREEEEHKKQLDAMLEDIIDDLDTISTNHSAEQPQPEQQVRNRILFLYLITSVTSCIRLAHFYDNHSFCRMELLKKRKKRRKKERMNKRICLHWELQVTDRITIIDFSNITY